MISRTIGILLSIAINFLGKSAIAREVSPRLIKLGLSDDYETPLICDKGSYCYKFDAVVDIDSGYLRVWTKDIEGTAFVYALLYKGDAVQVRGIYKHTDGQWRARVVTMYPACSRTSCGGWVDLRYLR